MSEDDSYPSMTALLAAKQEGVDYRIHRRRQNSDVAIVAPHGGHIEPGTFEIADAVADDRHNFYCFEALTDGLHVTSHHFDDPDCVQLVSACSHVVTIHGCKDLAANGLPDLTVAIGGLDKGLGAAIRRELEHDGFAIGGTSRFPGEHRLNICNRGLRGMGVQLELSWSLRDKLAQSGAGLDSQLITFAGAIHRALQTIKRN